MLFLASKISKISFPIFKISQKNGPLSLLIEKQIDNVFSDKIFSF